MTYVALARRYRPQTFAEVVGQPHVTDTLRAAVAGGRVAAAYLFTGPRGCGKTTVARILARAVDCDRPRAGEPCGQCTPCTSIAEGRSLDVLEIDGASNNSVDDVRELRENVGYAPSAPGKRKIYIVDEVHMLSTGAFNALLKTLEEPPAHVLFVLATTEPRKVPATIVSRCQRFDFRRLQTDEIRTRLGEICEREKIAVDAAAIFLLARHAEGSLRDALSLLDQVISSTGGRVGGEQVTQVLGLVPSEIYLDLTAAILERDAKRALEVLHGVLRQGVDASDFALGLVEHLRNLMLLGVDPALRGSVQLGDVHLQQAEVQAAQFRTEDLLFLLNRAAGLYEDTRRSPQPVVGLETALVEMTRFESRVVLSELLERLEGGGDPAPGPRDAGGGTPRATTAGPAKAAAEATARRGPGPRTAPRGTAAEPGATGELGAVAGGRTPAAVVETPIPGPGSSLTPDGTSRAPIAASVASPAPIAAGGPPPVATLRAAGGPHSGGSAGEPDLGAITARWQEFTQALHAAKAFLSVCLGEGRPVRLGGDTLEIHIPAEHTFHLHAVREAIRQREIDPHLRTFFGRPLVLALADEERAAAAPPAARLTTDDVAQSRRDALEDVVRTTPAIDDIIQAFDGEVLEERDG